LTDDEEKSFVLELVKMSLGQIDVKKTELKPAVFRRLLECFVNADKYVTARAGR
jgi:hypothetical protein